METNHLSKHDPRIQLGSVALNSQKNTKLKDACLMSNESVVILFVLDLNWSEFIVSSVTGIFIYYHSHTQKKKVKKETRRKKYVHV